MLELDRGNADRDRATSRPTTRSGATGRSSSASTRRRSSASRTPAERGAEVHRGGQARVGEAEEAVGLDRAVAEGARRATRRTSRRWASSRSSTSARRCGTSSPTSWRRRRGSSTTRQEGRAAAEARHPLHRQGQRAGARDRGVAGAARRRAGEQARRRTRSRSSTCSRRTSTSSRSSTRRRTSTTSTSACSSGRPRPRTTPPRSSLNVKIAELYRDRLQQGRPRDARLREGARRSTRRTCAAAEALIPLYEGAKDARKLVGVLEIQLGHTPRLASARVERMRRLAELSRAAAQGQGGGVRLVPEAVRRGSARRSVRARRSSGSPRRPAAGPSWSAPTKRRTRKSPAATSCRS